MEINKQLERIARLNRAADRAIRRIDQSVRRLSKEIEIINRYNRRMTMLLNGYKISRKEDD